MSNISIDALADEINKELQNYSNEVTKNVKKSVDKVATEVNKEIKKHISFKQPTGRYVESFRIKTAYEGSFNKRKTWYVANGHYRLTHLLEKGHALKSGGRTNAYPHIIYGEIIAKKRMEELVKEAIKNAGH
ncbi:hypothetical protein FDA09_11800 [Clostridium botulinum]|uniref:HK97 gp10 family phage protein n=1 Tax=Clostridium botulinum TaxID=1491 RepID=UPI000774680A|nr:HK97 gp10 family phage protein [Clostridium botulinum]NFF80435.1 hypothetical protein [Clostridium botulinum]NFH80834.1 hypothetical protein [Clostridium botulinum]NFH83211.1 hypothetical protein [Clostridium botulinum]NFI12076.1 hypothetical protein [Clostridium botulinum]NFI15775.1 hypothetical protein [Clostridium botulinum]